MSTAYDAKLEEFLKTLSIVEKLLRDKNIFFSISVERYPGLTLKIEEPSLDLELERESVSKTDFQSVLEAEIAEMIVMCLEGPEARQAYVKSEIDDLREEGYDETQLAEKKTLLEKKLEFVSTKLIDEHLRQRYLFKRRARVPVFIGLDWGINVREFDSQAEELRAFPYATIQIRYQKGVPAGPVRILLGTAAPLETLEVDCTLDEIEYMIRVLSEAKSRLQDATEKGG